MGGSRFAAFDLDKALCADGLVATAGMVDVGWIVQKADGTFYGSPVDCGLWLAWFFDHTGALRSLEGAGRGGRWGRGLLFSLNLGQRLPRDKNLVIVPVVLVVFERTVEWGESPGDNKLSSDGLVPVAGAGVDALWDELAVVDRVVVGAARGRGTVAHRTAQHW